ncbi:hypothetical protein [Streptomyces malaysiensis]|uniref:hypothetical protein n=1 Tax=Streptomyces malaysiensis TaxID=92644 RepID=UPI0036CAC5CD
MSIIIVDLAAGTTISPSDADDITKAAADAGVTAIRVLDGAPGQTLDASVIAFEGDYYRVAGPLDGPASPQGGPLLIADDVDTLGWDVIARNADVVVIDRKAVPTADTDLSAALARAGRPRESVALVVRVDVTEPEAVAATLPALVAEHGLDGVELVAAGGKDDVLALIAEVVPALLPSTDATLRSAFSLTPSA